jgi:hypothetical protein
MPVYFIKVPEMPDDEMTVIGLSLDGKLKLNNSICDAKICLAFPDLSGDRIVCQEPDERYVRKPIRWSCRKNSGRI